MRPTRPFAPFVLSLLFTACATAGGTFAPLGPDHPASASAPEVAIADPAELLFAREAAAPSRAAPATAAGAYVCPMHPEVASDQPGACPECGMKLVPREEARAEHDHDG